MKKFTLFFCFIMLATGIQAQNQKSGSIIRIGFGPNYYFGVPDNDINWDAENIGYQLDVMAGYRFSEKNSNPVVMGVFGRMGMVSESIVQKTLDEGTSLGIQADDTDQNEFYEAEVGMILFKLLRLSTGVGFQHYRLPEGDLQYLQYRNSTLGVQIHTRSVKWEINATALHDKDLDENILRYSASLGFEF